MELGGAQQLFARWIDRGAKIALVLLTAAFAVYVSGLLPSQLPPAELAKFWGLPLQEFVAATGAPTGWGWLELWAHGDYLNYFGIVLLVSIVMAAYLRILAPLARHHPSFAVIAVLEIVVLLAAASGLIPGVH